MNVSIELLDLLIANQQQSLRYYLRFAVGLILLGLLVMSATAFFSNMIIANAFTVLFGMGGAFVASLSSFQIREVASRKNTIQTLQRFKLILHSGGAVADADARKRVDEMIWKAVEKTILGAG